MKRTITAGFFAAHERLMAMDGGLKIGNRVDDPPEGIEAELLGGMIERHRHRGCGNLAGLHCRKIARRAAGDDEQFVIARVFESFLSQSFLQRGYRGAGQRGRADGAAAEIFHGLVVFSGDEHLGHAIDDAAGDGEIQPAFAGFDIRLGSPRADLQRSRRQGLQRHRHAAQQQQLNVESLLFEKSPLGADPKRTISQGLARGAKKHFGPLLGCRRRLEQKHN